MYSGRWQGGSSALGVDGDSDSLSSAVADGGYSNADMKVASEVAVEGSELCLPTLAFQTDMTVSCLSLAATLNGLRTSLATLKTTSKREASSWLGSR